MILKNHKIILASKSPRRRDLLKTIVRDFRTIIKEIDEDYPAELPSAEVAEYLARLKATPFLETTPVGHVVITADTVVVLDDKIYGKPKDEQDAFKILKELSGKKHQVITGVCLTSSEKQVSFSECTDVYFKELSYEEMDYYIENYQPFDKAGAYAIQEWIGMIAIEKIDGDYFNVVGLPVQALYKALNAF